jgi:hypothetical protein
MPTPHTPDPCLAGKGCNQHCSQGDYCPQTNPHAARMARMRDAQGSNVRYIHAHPDAAFAPFAPLTDEQLTTPGQLARSEDEREGRVDTVLENISLAVLVALFIVIIGVPAGFVYARWGSDIAAGLGQIMQALQALQAWEPMWR